MIKTLNCFSCMAQLPLDDPEKAKGVKSSSTKTFAKTKAKAKHLPECQKKRQRTKSWTDEFSFDYVKSSFRVATLSEKLRQHLGKSANIRTNLAPTPRTQRSDFQEANSVETQFPQTPLRYHASSSLIINSTFLSSRQHREEEIIEQNTALSDFQDISESSTDSFSWTDSDRESRSWSEGRCELQNCIERELTRVDTPVGAKEYLHNSTSRLKRRLKRLNLGIRPARGDGNCQFRAISIQLFGSEDLYEMVRERSVSYLAENRKDYVDFLGEDSFEEYLRNMRVDKVWGDEITLCCAANVFDCIISVITSESHNWYLQYRPKGNCNCQTEIFLGYTFPLHYDAVCGQGVLKSDSM